MPITGRILGALALGLCLSCASYRSRTASALADFQNGRLERARSAYADQGTTRSVFLSGAEAGTVALAAGEWDRAIDSFATASDAVKEAERSALISPESLGRAILAWTFSESATGYMGEGYERVMVHGGAALAYLGKGDVEGARVEMRRADDLLTAEEKLYEKEYRAGGLGHFLSGVLYELEGKADEAWIDYRRMAEKKVGTELAARALLRLAEVMDRADEVERWQERYGPAVPQPPGSASLVLIAGVGLGPYKREKSLAIMTPKGLLKWAVPEFARRSQPVAALELSVAGGDRPVRSVVVEDVGAVARENLDDRIAWLAAKSTVRTALKFGLTRELQREFGLLGRIAGDVFNFASERADLRAWQTLPDTWQAARVFLPAGSHEIMLRAVGGEGRSLGTFQLEEGETMFVIARTVGTRLYAHTVGGGGPTHEETTP